jgi:hypothetical protein
MLTAEQEVIHTQPGGLLSKTLWLPVGKLPHQVGTLQAVEAVSAVALTQHLEALAVGVMLLVQAVPVKAE